MFNKYYNKIKNLETFDKKDILNSKFELYNDKK